MTIRVLLLLMIGAGALAPRASFAQQPTAHVLHGSVTAAERPVRGADVFLLESLDATTTDSAGRFSLRTAAAGSVTLVVRRIGFAPASLVVPVDTAGAVTFALVPQTAALAPITVQAGAYTAGNERGASLTALEVVTTPGATADIARAIQTLPGVQNVDEGTGLFVRGGDVSETKVLLNNTVMLSPYNYQTPTGNYTVTVNPFLLDGIFFSSGGFGARYGNILSGVADLQTAGRPAQSSETVVAGLASVSAGADLALSNGLAVHATAGHSDLRYLFDINGSTRDYSPIPNGNDFSGSVVYDYSPTGHIKTFAIDRTSAVGVQVSDPSYTGGYFADVKSRMFTSGWSDVFGSFAPEVSVSYSTARRTEEFGVFDLGTDESWTQLFTQTTWSVRDGLGVRAGGDADWRNSRFDGSLPLSFTDEAPGARRTLFDSPVVGVRSGAFAEADWRALTDLRVIAGARTDYSSLTRARTVDPRVSAAYERGPATLTAAFGNYHQVADPLYLAQGVGLPGAPPERALQSVLGAQIGNGNEIARVELYDKQYRDLIGLTRDDRTVADGGTGVARGADVFVKHQLWPFFSARMSYSYVHSWRTDPDTRVQAPAPFDITNSLTIVGEQALPKGWSASAAWRYATGKPYTPVTGATFDAATQVWIPQYAAPQSARLPAEEKFDVAVSRATRIAGNNQLVYFFSLDNVLNRVNLYEYTYTPDYSRRIPVRSLFNRSLYFGASLTHLGH
jgi:vitamin B12 transporter